MAEAGVEGEEGGGREGEAEGSFPGLEAVAPLRPQGEARPRFGLGVAEEGGEGKALQAEGGGVAGLEPRGGGVGGSGV